MMNFNPDSMITLVAPSVSGDRRSRRSFAYSHKAPTDNRRSGSSGEDRLAGERIPGRSGQLYIQNPGEHHARLSFRDELIALLEARGVEYDPDLI